MAGTRQHYIPQFLLKGFSVDEGGSPAKVWVFRREKEPFLTSTKNVALEVEFYGSPGDGTVDGAITDLEGVQADCIRQAREIASGTDISQSGIADFIVNMSVRHKYLRLGMADTTDRILSEIDSFYSIPEHQRIFNENYFRKNPQVIEEQLDKVLASMPVSSSQKSFFRRYVRSIPPDDLIKLIGSQFDSALADFQAVVFPRIRNEMEQIIKSSHINALRKSLISNPRLDSLKRLNWVVVETDSELITGDICIVFEAEGYDRVLPITGAADDISRVLFPIAKNRVIIGTPNITKPVVDTDDLNRKIARNSFEFIVSSRNSEVERELQAKLGLDARLLSDEEIQKMLEESLSGE